MAHDPYGFEEAAAPPGIPTGKGEGGLLAGFQVLVWGLLGLFCAGSATALMAFADENDSLAINFLVWMMFSAPAWPLFGAAIVTVFLRSAVARWWAVAGPNVIVGAGAGCLLWLVVFMSVFVGVVILDMKSAEF